MPADESPKWLREALQATEDWIANIGGAPTLRCYTWLPGDCEHEENLPCNYEVYLDIHDYVSD